MGDRSDRPLGESDTPGAFNPGCGSDEPDCPGDFNGDGEVGGADLSALLGAWGTQNAELDLSGDGIIGGADLSILLGSWGLCL